MNKAIEKEAEEKARELKNPRPSYNIDMDSDTKEYYEGQGEYGIMYSENEKWSHRECTKRAYGMKEEEKNVLKDELSKRSLYFHTPLLDKEEALNCIKEIPKYNRFDPEDTIRMLKEMPDDTKIAAARESSVALYVWTDKASLLAEVFDDYPDEFNVVENFPSRAVGRKPNEVGDGEWVLVRLWWD